MKISFIIPAYNEESTIEEIVKKVEETDLDLAKEIVLIDDGSTDNSKSIIKRLPKKYKKIYHSKNLGKGAAIRTGLKHATGDLIIIQDADLEYDPNDIRLLVKPILEEKADVVFGSRFMPYGMIKVQFFWHKIGNQIITLFTNIVLNQTFTDVETCYKLFKKEIIKELRIEEDRFGFEPEITIKISQMKCRIYEVGISYYGRNYHQGKKIGWKDGVRALICIFKYGILRKVFTGELLLERILREYRIRKILRHIKSWQNVCDIGCGKHMVLLKKINEISKNCVGVDKKIPPINYSNIKIKQFDIEDRIPMEDDSFDTVTLLAVLEHLDCEKRIIKEIYRILRPNGILLITVPTKKAKPFIEFLAFKLNIISKEEVSDHKRYYTKDNIKKLLLENKFRCKEIRHFEFGCNIFCKAEKVIT